MDPATLLPIRPTSPSLAAHLASLTNTISHLEKLPSQTRWPAYVPLTSRARIPGQIVHPNEVKVNLGQGWWVEMTAAEAAQYLRRRKMNVLEEQAKMLEGGLSAELQATAPTSRSSMALPPTVPLNGLFMGLETSQSISKAKDIVKPVQRLPQSAPAIQKFIPAPTPPKSTSPNDASTSRVVPNPSGPSQPSQLEAESLEQVLENFLLNEKSLAEASGGGRESTVTEEGLPIHEIHETTSGEIIGTVPEPSLSEAEAGRLGAAVEVEDGASGEGSDGFLSEEAKARRRALFERVFGKDEDDEDEEDDEEDKSEGKTAEKDGEEEISSASSSPRSTSPDLIAPLPSTRHLIPPSPAPVPSIPRSILKPPPVPIRKKSVSFDPTVPLPPESPDPSTRKMGFQLPNQAGPETDEAEFGVRPVPVIQAPVPGKKSDGFGGMRRGFLDPPGGSKVKTVPKVDEGKKKPSLFAQRMAQSVVKESPMSAFSPTSSLPTKSNPSAKARLSGLPVMSASATSATNTLRSSVVEKPIASTSSAGPSTMRQQEKRQHIKAVSAEDDQDEEEEEEEEEEEDDDDYDLDDALLAREVALEYHRRRAYASPYMTQDPDDPAYGQRPSDPSSDGGVLLAMPQVDHSGVGGPTIVSPTPDDIKRFIRVGKLENGILILAPGEEGWSDDEEGEDGEGVGEMEMERRRKRDNRQKVMQGLMASDSGERGAGGGEAVMRGKGTIGNSIGSAAKMGNSNGGAEQKDMPPVVGSAPRETIAPAVGGVKERTSEGEVSAPSAEPPKKMSRFKAARMGGA